jgi:hypothetical protein
LIWCPFGLSLLPSAVFRLDSHDDNNPAVATLWKSLLLRQMMSKDTASVLRDVIGTEETETRNLCTAFLVLSVAL